MTETTAINEAPTFGPAAFTLALILAPLGITLISAPLVIPLFALALGGPVYLAAGAPMLLWMVGRYPPGFGTYALAGLALNVTLFSLLTLLGAVFPPDQAGSPTGLGLFYLIFGSVFAPLWTGTFAIFYRRMNRMRYFIPRN